MRFELTAAGGLSLPPQITVDTVSSSPTTLNPKSQTRKEGGLEGRHLNGSLSAFAVAHKVIQGGKLSVEGAGVVGALRQCARAASACARALVHFARRHRSRVPLSLLLHTSTLCRLPAFVPSD